MLWQYRTILFEFTKDGLLGDRYVDDEEMEKTLNEMGALGWELVNVTLLQDGLLAFLKRATGAGPAPGIEARPAAVPAATREVAQEPAEQVDGQPLFRGPGLRDQDRPAPEPRRPVITAAAREERDVPSGLERRQQQLEEEFDAFRGTERRRQELEEEFDTFRGPERRQQEPEEEADAFRGLMRRQQQREEERDTQPGPDREFPGTRSPRESDFVDDIRIS